MTTNDDPVARPPKACVLAFAAKHKVGRAMDDIGEMVAKGRIVKEDSKEFCKSMIRAGHKREGDAFVDALRAARPEFRDLIARGVFHGLAMGVISDWDRGNEEKGNV